MTRPKPYSKSEIITELAKETGLKRQQVISVLDALVGLTVSSLKQNGPGQIKIPDLAQIKLVQKPATPEREGINPFTKEKQIFKAKPARNTVKITALKKLKESV